MLVNGDIVCFEPQIVCGVRWKSLPVGLLQSLLLTRLGAPSPELYILFVGSLYLLGYFRDVTE